MQTKVGIDGLLSSRALKKQNRGASPYYKNLKQIVDAGEAAAKTTESNKPFSIFFRSLKLAGAF